MNTNHTLKITFQDFQEILFAFLGFSTLSFQIIKSYALELLHLKLRPIK